MFHGSAKCHQVRTRDLQFVARATGGNNEARPAIAENRKEKGRAPFSARPTLTQKPRLQFSLERSGSDSRAVAETSTRSAAIQSSVITDLG